MALNEALQNIAIANNWEFKYARRDYQNLYEATQFIQDGIEGLGIGETVLFLDPVVRKYDREGINYSGNFMILTKSDLDDSYEGKFEKYIEPLEDKLTQMHRALGGCQFDINDWTAIEVVNVFDFNADGMSIRFALKGYH